MKIQKTKGDQDKMGVLCQYCVYKERGTFSRCGAVDAIHFECMKNTDYYYAEVKK